jgi:hypothetical protein
MFTPTLLTAVSTIGQGVAQNKYANAQADVAEQNAQLAQNRISDVEYQKQQQIGKINRDKQQTIGSQRAAMAANGIDSSYGSGLSALTDTAYTAQEDKNETEYNAAKQEYGYQLEANNYRNQANSYRAAGKNALWGGVIGAAGQYYSSLNPVAKKWKPVNKYTGMGDFKSANRY